MDHGKALDWGISGVGVMPFDLKMRDATVSQDCLYALVLKDPKGRWTPKVIGSIVKYLYAPDDPQAAIEQMADPATRIVSLTVTEGGYNFHPVRGKFDDRQADQLEAIASKQCPDPIAFIANRELFGDLIDEPAFVEPHIAALHSLHTRGARSTLEALST